VTVTLERPNEFITPLVEAEMSEVPVEVPTVPRILTEAACAVLITETVAVPTSIDAPTATAEATGDVEVPDAEILRTPAPVAKTDVDEDATLVRTLVAAATAVEITELEPT
jgi:hypothetical protein